MGTVGIEKRVAVLEKELASLREKVEAADAPRAWWDRIAGTFDNDPVYKRAMKLGRDYRKSQKPEEPPRKRK